MLIQLVSQPRIAFVDVPQMMLEILGDALRAASIPIVGEFRAGVSLVAAADRRNANVIVTSADRAPEAAVEDVLSAHPSARVLVFEGDGSQTVLYELRPRRVVLGELSPKALVRVITSISHSALGHDRATA